MADVTGGPGVWVGALALTLLGAWAMWFVPRMWRDPAYVSRMRQAGRTVVGERAGDALAALAPMSAGLTLLAGMMLLVALVERDVVGTNTIITGLRTALVWAVFTAVIVSISVLLFGWPVALVPPAARTTSGLLVRRPRR